MKLSQDLNNLINTYHALLEQCAAALAADVDQAKRDEIRDAINELLKSGKAEPQSGNQR